MKLFPSRANVESLGQNVSSRLNGNSNTAKASTPLLGASVFNFFVKRKYFIPLNPHWQADVFWLVNPSKHLFSSYRQSNQKYFCRNCSLMPQTRKVWGELQLLAATQTSARLAREPLCCFPTMILKAGFWCEVAYQEPYYRFQISY